jgi:hypothetical protein
MRVTAVAVLALAPVFAFTGAADAGHVSGLRGLVLQGPTKPVCLSDESCEEPARGMLLQFRRSGVTVAEVRTNRNGWYHVDLPAGAYGVKAPARRIGSGLTPRTVHVPRGQIARVDLHLDTGLQ